MRGHVNIHSETQSSLAFGFAEGHQRSSTKQVSVRGPTEVTCTRAFRDAYRDDELMNEPVAH